MIIRQALRETERAKKGGMIAFLGMGLLGANFVRTMRRNGEDVHVWNRTAEKAKVLETEGVAKAFEDPAQAVKGATRVHICVSDDAAVDDVLEKAKAGFDKGVTIVDHTTTSAPGAAARTAKWKERGYAYQHAPVFMGPKNALDATGVMMASGDRAQFDRLEPALSKMTGKLVHLGPEPDRAAGMKLIGNLFLISMMNSVFDMLGLAKSLGIPAEDAVGLFDFFNPGAMLQQRSRGILSMDFTKPSWELSMARKDARLMLESAKKADVVLTALPAIAKVMDAWIEKGHGQHDWSVISKNALGAL